MSSHAAATSPLASPPAGSGFRERFEDAVEVNPEQSAQHDDGGASKEYFGSAAAAGDAHDDAINGDGDAPHSDHGSTAGLTAAGQDGAADDQINEKDAAAAGGAAGAAGAAPLNRKQKLWKHFRKWWWAYGIGGIIFLAILLPIIFELIIPAIVQDIVNSQSLPIINGTLRAVSPDMIEISLNSTINTPIPARLGTFPLYLYYKNATDQPFANLTLPGQHISKNTPVTVTNQTIPINNQTTLVYWLNDLYDNTTVDLTVKSNLDVYLGILHSKPHLSKDLQTPGLNQLSGIGIEGLELIFPPMPNGYNINGTLNIPNSGNLGIGLGNISFNLLSGETNLGLVHLYDVTLQPGNTSSYFEGELYLDQLLPNIGPILQSQAKPLGDGVIQLNATGNSTMINGEHIPYVEAILNKKTLSLEISAITLLSDVISGVVGAGNASLIDALSDVFDNKTFFSNVLQNWEPPMYYANENVNDTYSRVKARRSATRNAVMWNMLKFGMNMKGRK